MFDWFRNRRQWSPRVARERILKGNFPRTMRVAGHLNLAGEPGLRALPARLWATSVNVSRCANLRAVPAELECWELIVGQSGIENLPAGLRVLDRLDAEGCRRLRGIGAYHLSTLMLRGCLALESLPEGLCVRRLDLSRCPLWSELPKSVLASVEFLDVSECSQLTALPDRFARLEGLNVSGCKNLTKLSAGMRIRSWIDVADSGLRELPWSLRSVRVMWHGVPVPDRVAFDPQSITVEEILGEHNQSMRRVLLERVGLDWFFDRAQPAVLDEDRDAGGARRLLRIDLEDDEAIVCVQVRCPSTGNAYLLRVPPGMLTCHEAIAWTAGYTNPHKYRPVVET